MICFCSELHVKLGFRIWGYFKLLNRHSSGAKTSEVSFSPVPATLLSTGLLISDSVLPSSQSLVNKVS